MMADMEQPMPDMKTINGHTYIKVKDLADQWYTTTSSILRTGKPGQVPEKYRRTIEGRTWCDVEGLRYRLNRMKRGGKIPGQLRQLLQRLPVLGFTLTGPLMETVYEKNGGTTTIYRSTFQNIDAPSSEELQAALGNRQIIYRYKNDGIQVLAQTLSNYLDTRTSSLLAVNKKQGVPQKYIHRQWKRTWVDLEGLKQRVQHTEHGSALLKGLNWVVEYLDGEGKPCDELVKTMKQWKSASASAASGVSNAPSATKPEQKPKTVKPCDLAVEANKRAVHNTERINNLTTEVRNNREQERAEVKQGFSNIMKRITSGEKRFDKKTTQNAVNQILLGELNTRLERLATQADSLDARADGMESRVSVAEDTNKWLSWTLAGVIGLRFLSLMLRWLRRK